MITALPVAAFIAFIFAIVPLALEIPQHPFTLYPDMACAQRLDLLHKFDDLEWQCKSHWSSMV
jgi:hypothetical protein